METKVNNLGTKHTKNPTWNGWEGTQRDVTAAIKVTIQGLHGVSG